MKDYFEQFFTVAYQVLKLVFEMPKWNTFLLMLNGFFLIVKRFHLNSSHMSFVNIVIPCKMFQAQIMDSIFLVLLHKASKFVYLLTFLVLLKLNFQNKSLSKSTQRLIN